MDEIRPQTRIADLTFQFSLKIIEYAGSLEQHRKYIVAKQLLRSGTSIGANVWEAQHAESRADFIHKLKIAAKEAEETIYWLLLCKNAKGYNNECDELIENCKSIKNVLAKIIVTAKRNNR
ncbi:MAG: four helix bundle protein [Ferruginibacter sp.]